MITLAAARRAMRRHRPRTVTAPDAQPAAVALILVDGAAGLEALFIHRAERAGDPWSGQVALPGGRRDPHDADLLATAIRETREETGVELGAAERLGALDDLHPRTPTLPPVVVRPFVFGLGERPTLTPSPEVQGAFWLALGSLAEPGVRQELTLTVQGTPRTFPAYRVREGLIWGMTERILTPFLQRVDAV
ncbi:MAG TPA: CoA pyrophosphatase [Gemmatimonadales bacterium]|nr:CoA pyrophosphatase [Gemmatimonadales bacterium]